MPSNNSNAGTKAKVVRVAKPAKPKQSAEVKVVKPHADAKLPADVLTPEGKLSEEGLLSMLGYQLAQASVVTMGNYHEAAGKPYGLRAAEYTMMALIDGNPGVSPAQLAKALGLSAPYVTAGLDKLCQRGWVKREVSTKDGRKQHIYTTEEGKTVAAELTSRVLESEQARFKTLTFAEKLMLAELLRKLARCRTMLGL